MPVGRLENEADLRRWLEQQLQSPGMIQLAAIPDFPFKGSAVNYGTVTLTFTGLDISGTVQVNHGLAKAPSVVLATVNSGVPAGIAVHTITDSQIELTAYSFVGAVNGDTSAAWFAIAGGN